MTMRDFGRRLGGRAALSAIPVLTGCGIFDGGELPARVQVVDQSIAVVFEQHSWAPEPIAYLEASALMVNTSPDPVTVSLPCPAPLEATRVGEGEVAWSLHTALTWPGSVPSACSLIGPPTVQPGDTLVLFDRRIRLARILADSLPAGPYHFQARFTVTETVGANSAPVRHALDLGEITLPESRHPLWAEMPRDGFIYTATIGPPAVLEQAGTVVLDVRQSGVTSSTLTRDLSLDCPVRLLAFRSRSEVETIPVPQPRWQWPPARGCSPGGMPIRLGPGERQLLELGIPSFSPQGAPLSDFVYMVVIDVDGRPIRLAVEP